MRKPQPLFRNFREIATLLMRFVVFAATLALIGAFFLPWVRLDGMNQVSSGAELVAIAVSPTVNYLFTVSTLQSAILVGCPALLIVSATIVMAKYGRRKTALFATCVVFASAMAIIYGAPDLTASNESRAYVGLSMIVVLSVALLIHQILIKLRSKLYYMQRLPAVYQVLSVVTGSGYYRWREK